MHLKTGLKVLFGKVKGRWLVRSITQIRLHVGTLLICHFLALHAITSSLVPILDLCAGTASKWCMADSISFVPGASEVDGHFNLNSILQLGMSFAYTTRKTQTQLKSAVLPGNESSHAKFNSGRGWSIWSVSPTLKVRITFVLWAYFTSIVYQVN